MKLWLDAQVAAAGDMILAALLDAGADLAAVRAGLDRLRLPRWTLEVTEVRRGAFRALRAEVRVDDAPSDARFTLAARGPGFGVRRKAPAHAHGAWSEIRDRIGGADLPGRVRDRALAAYGRLAEAEAALHGVPVDDVHLHEVGSTDAVIDVVGCCLALESLGIDDITASPLPLGIGSVAAAHGHLALPAPATLAVLRGWPVTPSALPGEWVTPTGAALISALARPGSPPAGTLGRVGHGAGRRDPPGVANLVRAVLVEAAHPATDEVVELACNLDDQPGVLLATVPPRLLAEGALDAWLAPIAMKKGRPGVVLHALVRPADADRLADTILRHTTSLGVRRSTWARRILDRRWETVETPWGAVRVKIGGRDGETWHATPETDDVLAVAEAAGVPAQQVADAATAAWRLTAAGTGR